MLPGNVHHIGRVQFHNHIILIISASSLKRACSKIFLDIPNISFNENSVQTKSGRVAVPPLQTIWVLAFSSHPFTIASFFQTYLNFKKLFFFPVTKYALC